LDEPTTEAHSQMERTDTYRSISSVNTNALSIVSASTTPTTTSNFSATSAGSLLRRRQDAYFKPSQAATMADDELGSETPVRLPSTKAAGSRSLNVRKSTGFLRKFFSSSKNASSSEQAETFATLRRTKSRSSISSSTSNKLRNSFRKVSSRTFSHGKSLSTGTSCKFSCSPL
jgi:hypothetical protein